MQIKSSKSSNPFNHGSDNNCLKSLGFRNRPAPAG
jgi:hypothetical protein